MSSKSRSRVSLATMPEMANNSRSSRSRYQKTHNNRHSKKGASLNAAPASSQRTGESSLEPAQMAPALAQRLNPALIVETACGMDSVGSRSRFGESRGQFRQRSQEILPSSVLAVQVVPLSQRSVPTIVGRYRGDVITLKMMSAAYGYPLPGRNSWKLRASTGSAKKLKSSLESGSEQKPHRHSSGSGRPHQLRVALNTPWSLLLTCLLLTCLPSPGHAFACRSFASRTVAAPQYFNRTPQHIRQVFSTISGAQELERMEAFRKVDELVSFQFCRTQLGGSGARGALKGPLESSLTAALSKSAYAAWRPLVKSERHQRGHSGKRCESLVECEATKLVYLSPPFSADAAAVQESFYRGRSLNDCRYSDALFADWYIVLNTTESIRITPALKSRDVNFSNLLVKSAILKLLRRFSRNTGGYGSGPSRWSLMPMMLGVAVGFVLLLLIVFLIVIVTFTNGDAGQNYRDFKSGLLGANRTNATRPPD
ncbi:hypothetical protein BIW11_02744 [Tropilaelaps mercedesae]|uniref:Uncharacterized protein n=1 Tax=Tropilaelaps mercedesae TaxID=418985 RepID=A0A1V9XXX9_9ACAR|nr:hypothetical protein BIW11_02744 [Tropilaelaps mercedesae]